LEIDSRLKLVAARLAFPKMPNAAFADMLRPSRRNQSLAALRARGQLTVSMSSRTVSHIEHLVLPVLPLVIREIREYAVKKT
jgi:hypothetical protein